MWFFGDEKRDWSGCKATIYARASTKKQEHTLERQVNACSEWAKSHGVTLVGEPYAEIVSGATDSRKAFQKMVEDARSSPEWSLVLVEYFDRFSRMGVEMTRRYEEKINQAGVSIVACHDSLQSAQALVKEIEDLFKHKHN